MSGISTSAQGFSLLELLVAVSILALAAIPILSNQGQGIRMAAQMQDKVLAHAVAENTVALLSVKSGVGAGVLEGEQRQGGALYLWRADITRPAGGDLMMMSVSVTRPQNPTRLAQLTGFRKVGD